MATSSTKSTDAAAPKVAAKAKDAPSNDVQTPDASAPVVRRKELVERIATRSGVKPNVIKSVLDSILQEMGDALQKDETLNIPPFGKISVNRRKSQANAEIIICKLRRANASTTPADADE